MPIITLPNGDQKQFDQAVSVMDVALSIGPGLAKNTVAGKVDGRLVDASDLITTDASLQIITPKDEEGVEIIRHSCAHLVGHAVKQLFPEAKMVIGPVIEDGFYYDIFSAKPFTPEDMLAIEERMKKLIDQDYDVIKKMTPRDEVIAEFTARGEDYKLRLIADMPEETEMGLYYHQDYLDMCRGPHVPNTKFLKAFKLTKMSGAYWRGDAKNEQLQRIYGTAWADKKQLAAYIKRIEEAEKRDHRKIGKALDLFHMQEEAPGMVFWHPNGWTIYQVLEQYMRKVQQDNGYLEIRTPQVVDFTLWEKSGHAANYADGMFTTHSESRNYAIKPMNCPCHVQVFNQGLKSYRDLPIRLAEFGSCHRNEPSGSLHGIMRVRGFTQDDAHIFCTKEQIGKEVADFIKLTLDVYKDFGFEEVQMKLSDSRDIRGKRHELAFIVVLFLTSILRSDKLLNLSVIHRAMLDDFEKLAHILGIKVAKCISYSQLKRLLQLIDYEQFCGIEKPTAAAAKKDNTVKEISVTELKALKDQGADFQLIDVREEYEYEIANLADLGAELIPLATVPANAERIAKGKQVIIHCHLLQTKLIMITRLTIQLFLEMMNRCRLDACKYTIGIAPYC